MLDDRWLLAVPTMDEPAREEWARERVAMLHSEPERNDPEQTAQDLARLAALADDSALATMIFCPDGLPGRALVSVYGEETQLETLDDLPELAPASLPRQVLPLGEHPSSRGRVVSTLTQVPDVGVVGTLQFELLRDGALLEVIATSPSLPHLGSGMQLFTELIERITIGESVEKEQSRVTA
ncbi:hypothetical protein [Okibacterium endophyticum]